MKKIIFFLVCLVLLSCEQEEVDRSQALEEEFYELVSGRYSLLSVEVDPPIDLNHDGVPHADLYKEVIYCNMSYDLDSYSCKLSHTATYSEIIFYVPTSEYSGSGAGVSTCLRDIGLACKFKVNAETREVIKVHSDHWKSFNAMYNAEILSMHWENKKMYFKLRKRYLVSSGEQKWVTLYLAYEMFSEIW